ncbi:MAG TPA: low affinity iron permease family protein [Luteimonas sp.]|nr:low affinity iron permease family protein [Luteimonas sp.]
MKGSKAFTRFAQSAAKFTGKPMCFALAAGLIIAWAITGPIFKFDNTWQLVINTGTTIITFLMVFLIQNTQNRDTEALQIKLDELIRATGSANNSLLALEELDDEALEKQRKYFARLAREAREAGNEDVAEGAEADEQAAGEAEAVARNKH